jgi:homospermidine synthase
MKFKHKVLFIGYGSVARCALPILLEHVDIPCRNITIIDMADKRKELADWLRKGVNFYQEKITPINIYQVLSKYISVGGLIIDLSWNIDCLDILRWCHDNKVLYVNTSVEEWDPYANISKKTPFEKSLYYRQMEIRKMIAAWPKRSTTAVLDHGANPGLVSHFTKQALLDIARKSLKNNHTVKKQRKFIERYMQEKKFPQLAMVLGVKVIHISERDTQITDRPKELNEFVNTWSIEGLREEGVSPAELGWGTHEKKPSVFYNTPSFGPKNQIFLSQMGMNTWVRTWVPHTEIIGMAIRHAEAFSISDYLTVRDGGKAVYRPTVHYAYMPCDETLASLHELRGRNYELQEKQRIMNDEITKGEDILGVLLMGHRYNSWWTGSVLSIKEARRLVPGQNATTIQVAIGVISAAKWLLENPQEGLKTPDELPYEEILATAKPYLGKSLSIPSSWTPFSNYQIFFRENPAAHLDKKNPWCFDNFLFKD